MSEKRDKSLEKLFNLPAEHQPEIITETGLVIPVKDNIAETDYSNARENIYALIEKANEAADVCLQVAKSSEHPRAFEVYGNLIATIADLNKQLLELQVQKSKLPKEIEKPDNQQEGAIVNNNTAIFVGSSAELNNLIENIVNPKKKDE